MRKTRECREPSGNRTSTEPGLIRAIPFNFLNAENEKIAAIDYATAVETQADGLRRAAIKQAEGQKSASILVAEGQAEAIRLVNEAANKYFINNAQKLKALEVTQASLEKNAKFIVPAGQSVVNIIGGFGSGDNSPGQETVAAIVAGTKNMSQNNSS